MDNKEILEEGRENREGGRKGTLDSEEKVRDGWTIKIM